MAPVGQPNRTVGVVGVLIVATIAIGGVAAHSAGQDPVGQENPALFSPHLVRADSDPSNLTAIISNVVLRPNCASGKEIAYFYGNATGGSPPYGFTWSFGDGSRPVGGQDVTHAYLGPAVYNVTLWVTDALGDNASAETRVSPVPPFCPANFVPAAGSFPPAIIGLLAATGTGFVGLSSVTYFRTKSAVRAGRP